MAALPKVKHILTIGSDKYSFYAQDIYANLGAQSGVTKAPANDSTVYRGELTRDSFYDGKAIRVKARGTAAASGNTPGKSRDFTFVLSFEKAREALPNIGSKTVTVGGLTYNLGKARIPGRRRFS